jgi:hypothetical protein
MIQSEIVEIIPLSEVTEGAAVPSSLGDEKKRRVLTREIYKWKARMNLDGSKQGRNRLRSDICSSSDVGINPALLGMVLKNKWKTKQLDYVLAFPQAPVDRECFMKMPLGIKQLMNLENGHCE